MRRRVVLPSLVLAVVGAAVALVGVAIDPREGIYAWHFALMVGVTTTVGALFLLMLGHVMNAGWFLVVRRPVEHLVGALPLMALLFIPSVLFLPQLFPWAEGGIELHGHEAEVVAQKRGYLNAAGFIVRTIVYLLVFIGAGELLRYWSGRQDHASDLPSRIRYAHRMRVLSAVGFPLLALLMTGAFVDWMMSLQPAWHSTMFPPAVLAGGFVAAVGIMAVTLVIAGGRDWIEGVRQDHRHAAGRMLFASICFWGYLNFAQYLIIWVADLPEEILFLQHRQQGGWQWLGVALVFGHLVIPFFLLLSRRLKEIPATLAFFGAWIVVFHLLAVYWLVIPAHRPALEVHWADPFALLMVVGGMLAVAVARSTRVAPVPLGAPGLAEGFRYSSP